MRINHENIQFKVAWKSERFSIHSDTKGEQIHMLEKPDQTNVLLI